MSDNDLLRYCTWVRIPKHRTHSLYHAARSSQMQSGAILIGDCLTAPLDAAKDLHPGKALVTGVEQPKVRSPTRANRLRWSRA